MTELFIHDVTVSPYDEDFEAEYPLFGVSFKDWEGNAFKIVLNEDEAKMLSIQLGYHLYEREG